MIVTWKQEATSQRQKNSSAKGTMTWTLKKMVQNQKQCKGKKKIEQKQEIIMWKLKIT